MDRVRRHFLSSLERGKVLSLDKLRDWVRRKRLRGVTEGRLRRLRQYWKEISKFGTRGGRPRHYQSIQIPKLGTVQMDGGYFERGSKANNDGMIGFLLFVSASTGLLHALPMANRTIPEYVRLMKSFMKRNPFPAVDTLQSDKERAVVSDEVGAFLAARGVSLQLLTSKRKAFLAERAIRTVKTQLSMVMERRRSKRWVDWLSAVIDNLNDSKAYGTTFNKRDVNRKNFLKFLDERFQTSDHTMSYSGSAVDFDAVKMAGWADKIFAFSPGAKVLVSYTALQERKKRDVKRSQLGSYSEEEHRVTRAFLKSDSKGDLVPGTAN